MTGVHNPERLGPSRATNGTTASGTRRRLPIGSGPTGLIPCDLASARLAASIPAGAVSSEEMRHTACYTYAVRTGTIDRRQ